MPHLHITQSGQGTGTPLLLLHGWGFDSQIWSSLLPELERHYLIYLVDLPGFGKTSCLSWPDFSKQLLDYLPPAFNIAGWSMGGLIATRLTIENPERITRLINIASSPCFVNNPDTAWPGIQAQNLQLFYTNLLSTPEKTHQDFINLQLGSRTQTNPITHAQITSDGLKQGLDILMHWDLREQLKHLTVPTHYLFGRLDSIVPAKTMAAMQTLYPKFEYYLFPRAAHAPFLSHPEIFLDYIKNTTYTPHK
ncbi:MAG: alpha/beta fold hydrolase [Legionellaceae bacterium]|nr:alpha/beta fold hydrolase [Legionellaceae bacterium]